MNLIPTPLNLNRLKGEFKISPLTKIVLGKNCSMEDFATAKELKKEILKTLKVSINITKVLSDKKNDKNCIILEKKIGDSEGYSLNIDENNIDILGNDESGLFYGVQTLIQIIRSEGNILPCVCINDKPSFKYRGFYHDVTRGKVPTLETLKHLVDKCAYYKLNQLQLYIEHTYAFKNISELWADSDPLTAEEILLLDEYAKSKHVELVPSMATFGHLYEILRTKSYSELCELSNKENEKYSWSDRMAHHTLNVSDDKGLELIKNMIKEYIVLFSSNKFNICCDETFDLGRGKSKKLVDEEGKIKVYVSFLNKIINYVKGFNKQVMFWGDIILGQPELAKEIPEDVICLNWNYHPQAYEYNFKLMSDIRKHQYICSGTAVWSNMAPNIEASFSNIKTLGKYGVKYKAEGFLNTDWGDFGHINLLANSMPGLIYGAAVSWNTNIIDKEVYEAEELISKVEYGDEEGKIVSLISELNSNQYIKYGDVVTWAENKFVKNGEALKDREEYIISLKSIPTDKAELYNNRIKGIEKELQTLLSNSKYANNEDKVELLLDCEGVMLFNNLFLLIQKFDLDCYVARLSCNPKELAIEFEYWFDRYSKAWKARNKTSELFRIKELIQNICSWLRNIDINK